LSFTIHYLILALAHLWSDITEQTETNHLEAPNDL